MSVEPHYEPASSVADVALHVSTTTEHLPRYGEVVWEYDIQLPSPLPEKDCRVPVRFQFVGEGVSP